MALAQKNIATRPLNGKRCRLCGTPIDGRSFIREGEEYCCEGCFLGRKECRGIEAERDNAYLALAEALAAALDAREHETGLHSKRVACHTLALARRFTDDPQRLRQVYWGALLHDLGKIGIPDAILLKVGPLTEDEWGVMRTHPEIGQRILAAVPFMAEAAEIVLNHEERFDGTGYPRGLRGEAIPLWARLFAVIDTLDAMTSDRPYRKGLSFDAAKVEILRLTGTQFDPLAVEAFSAEEKTLREMVAVKCGKASIAMEAG
ncbi:MAG: HD-GYP domain-containing protein [Sulfuricella sp.]